MGKVYKQKATDKAHQASHDVFHASAGTHSSGMSAAPNSHAPLGQGGRFAALKKKLGSKPGITNPGALAAYIGRKKYGAKKFASLSAKGKMA